MPERKTLNEDLLYGGSSANLPRLHEIKVPFWDFSQFAITHYLTYYTHTFKSGVRNLQYRKPLNTTFQILIQTPVKIVHFYFKTYPQCFLKKSNLKKLLKG